jgi:hypothetical protein
VNKCASVNHSQLVLQIWTCGHLNKLDEVINDICIFSENYVLDIALADTIINETVVKRKKLAKCLCGKQDSWGLTESSL